MDNKRLRNELDRNQFLLGNNNELMISNISSFHIEYPVLKRVEF